MLPIDAELYRLHRPIVVEIEEEDEDVRIWRKAAVHIVLLVAYLLTNYDVHAIVASHFSTPIGLSRRF
jgi:hypothetical protein